MDCDDNCILVASWPPQIQSQNKIKYRSTPTRSGGFINYELINRLAGTLKGFFSLDCSFTQGRRNQTPPLYFRHPESVPDLRPGRKRHPFHDLRAAACEDPQWHANSLKGRCGEARHPTTHENGAVACLHSRTRMLGNAVGMKSSCSAAMDLRWPYECSSYASQTRPFLSTSSPQYKTHHRDSRQTSKSAPELMEPRFWRKFGPCTKNGNHRHGRPSARRCWKGYFGGYHVIIYQVYFQGTPQSHSGLIVIGIPIH